MDTCDRSSGLGTLSVRLVLIITLGLDTLTREQSWRRQW